MTAKPKQTTETHDAPTTAELIPIKDVEKVTSWPFSYWHTSELIRTKKLGCVKMGRRVFVTVKMLDKYTAEHEVKPEPSND